MLQKTHISLIICDLQEFARFYYLPRPPGFAGFRDYWGEVVSNCNVTKNTYISNCMRFTRVRAIFTTYHVPRVLQVFGIIGGRW